MNLNESILKNEERISLKLRSLYQQYGFMQYKMSKFEEYDLYAGCRDYLSDNIITFTDTNGRLMALKPDVTLSIVRSTKEIPGYVSKIFYNENVYRVSHGSHVYKEIMQAGLECIGDIDDYNIFETVLLAVKSLAAISEDYVLSLSHLGIITSLLDELGLDDNEQKTAVQLIGRKNMHEFKALCEAAAAGRTAEAGTRTIDEVISVLMLHDRPEAVIESLQALNCNAACIDELKRLTAMLNAAGEGDRLVIDFSVVSDMKYYNGIVFKGYINGVPEGILSGGQYDALLKQMGKHMKAVGFAVYMDFLERYFENDRRYDVDAVIKYDNSTDRRALFNAIQVAMNKGLKVTAQKSVPDKLRYRILYRIDQHGALREAASVTGKEAE